MAGTRDIFLEIANSIKYLSKRVRKLETQTYRSKFGYYQEFNVRDYGALGTYDDDVSSAINSILTSYSYGVIYFPCVDGDRTVYRLQSATSIPRTFEIKIDSGAILWIDHASALIAPQQPLHAEWFGADSQAAATTAGCSIDSGSTQLTVDTASTFKLGNGIIVPGAGAAAADLFARIVEINGLVFTLNIAASTTVAGVRCLADDSIAIQTIIDNCMSINTTISHVLYLCPGITQIYQPIVIDQSMRLCGRVRAWDKVIGDPTANSLIQLGATVNLEIDHLYFGCYNDTIIDSNGYTFIDGSIHDCWFVATAGIAGSKAIDCLFSTTDIYNCIFEAIVDGIVIRPGSGYVNIDNCLFAALDNTAIYAVGTNVSHIRDINISNITYPIDQPGGALPCIFNGEYCDNININNISARNQLTAIAGYLCHGIRLVYCTRVGINNVNMLNAVRTGIAASLFSALVLDHCDDVKVTNFVHIADAGKECVGGFAITTCTGVDISNFTINGTDSHAIYLAGINLPLNIHNGRILNAGAADNTKAAILGAAGITHISDLYMLSSAAYSDYAIDPTGITAGAYFIFEKSSIDGFVSGLWDTTLLTANPNARTMARDLDIGAGAVSFTANDTTPCVAGGAIMFLTANNPATLVAMLDNGYYGQTVMIKVNDGNTTFDFSGTNLKGNNGVDYAASLGDVLRCFFDGTDWFCEIIQG